jgi:transmembrane 9 superfamily member 2/4
MSLTALIALVITFKNSELSPTIYITLMVMLACLGHVNGYVTARYLRFFGNSDFKLAVIISALALPAFIIGVFLVEIFFAYI